MKKERTIPKHTSKIEKNGSVVYLMDNCEAKFFKGRAVKPTHYYRFKTEERRTQYIENFFNDIAESIAYKAKRKAEAEKRAELEAKKAELEAKQNELNQQLYELGSD